MDSVLATRSFFVHEILRVGYIVAERVGVGQSAIVHRAFDASTSSVVALKIFNRARDGTEDMEAEVRLYERLDQVPSVARRLFGNVIQHGITDHYAYFSMPFFPGSLSDALDIPGVLPLSVRHVKSIFKQILEGLKHMHLLLIIHTDMKPDNIMLRSLRTTRSISPGNDSVKVEITEPEIVIVDYAASVWNVDVSYAMAGTNAYRAPEVTLGLGWNYAMDVFSSGCILAELCVGRPLFPDTKSAAQRMFLLERVIEHIPSVLTEQAERRFPSLFASRGGRCRVVVAHENVHELLRLCKVGRIASLQVQIKDKGLHKACFDTLRLDPRIRISASGLLADPMFCA